jgi:CRP-like cAMP-binding protein
MSMALNLNQAEIKWLLNTLKKIDFFANASIFNIDKIIGRFNQFDYKKGEVLIKEGAVGIALFIIRTGRCLVYKKKGWFGITPIVELKEGDFFGEMSLVFDDKTSASVKTSEPSTLYVLVKNDFNRCLADNPEMEKEIKYIAERRKYESLIKPKH